ncbi:MAG: hypothetical protein IJV46_09925 [Acidaminococcaceae bacterium]|nr:hypothetical protein [Acidaminococcaceae bacterium]
MAEKTFSVNIRLTEGQTEGLKALAGIKGVNVSEYIRLMVDGELEKNRDVLDDYTKRIAELRAKMK